MKGINFRHCTLRSCFSGCGVVGSSRGVKRKKERDFAFTSVQTLRGCYGELRYTSRMLVISARALMRLGGSFGLGGSMFALRNQIIRSTKRITCPQTNQWAVPSMKTGVMPVLVVFSTLNACHGSMEPLGMMILVPLMFKPPE